MASRFRNLEWSVKLLIVDDSSAVYGRLLALLGGVESLTALSIARSFQEVEEKTRSYCPEAAVLDIHLPDGSGLDAVQMLKTRCPACRVYIFSNQSEFMPKAMAAGADGFFDKSMEFESLIALLTQGAEPVRI